MKRWVWMLSLGAVLGCVGCGPKESAPGKATNETSSAGNPLTAPVDYLGAAAKAQQSASKTTSTLGIQQAIKLFQTQEGRNPQNLNELVGGDYLSRLPDPPAGMKFDYNPETAVIRVVPAP